MPHCCINGCDNARYNGTKDVTYFNFPMHNRILLRKWLEKIELPNWKPTHHQICSMHFAESDINSDPKSMKLHLKANSVPTIFPVLNVNANVTERRHCRPTILRTAQNGSSSSLKTTTTTTNVGIDGNCNMPVIPPDSLILIPTQYPIQYQSQFPIFVAAQLTQQINSQNPIIISQFLQTTDQNPVNTTGQFFQQICPQNSLQVSNLSQVKDENSERVSKFSQVKDENLKHVSQFSQAKDENLEHVSEFLQTKAQNYENISSFSQENAQNSVRTSEISRIISQNTIRMSRVSQINLQNTIRMSQISQINSQNTAQLSQISQINTQSPTKTCQLSQINAQSTLKNCQISQMNVQSGANNTEFLPINENSLSVRNGEFSQREDAENLSIANPSETENLREIVENLADQTTIFQPKLRKILPKPVTSILSKSDNVPRLLQSEPVRKPDILILPIFRNTNNPNGPDLTFVSRYPGNKRPTLRITINKSSEIQDSSTIDEKTENDSTNEESHEKEITIVNERANRSVTFRLDRKSGEIVLETRKIVETSRDDRSSRTTRTKRKVDTNESRSSVKLHRLYERGQRECSALRKRLRFLRQCHRREKEEIQNLQDRLSELADKVQKTCDQEEDTTISRLEKCDCTRNFVVKEINDRDENVFAEFERPRRCNVEKMLSLTTGRNNGESEFFIKTRDS